ncbi:MAG: hypothetical protein IPM56_08935 [Ignavibacteriales bacterium]|nr:MAG: hypothetical protein IPM56_08935 [Ignavibacteriales bacterium]
MKKYNIINILFAAVIMFGFFSCTEDFTDQPQGNRAPETGLFLYPDSTIAQQPSRIYVSWWGDDPDGLIQGFYILWEGIDTKWSFTTSNDSIFSLPIGTSDTTFNFLVSAVDNEGNGRYDASIVQNGIDYGPEPFVDRNGNNVYDAGELFFDIGLIDPTPASTLFPIKNSPPVVAWNELSFVPDTSFPVMTFNWNASDLDGDESITEIRLSLNDTSNYVVLPGNTRLITVRGINLDSPSPEMQILINGSDQNIHSQNLSGLLLNQNNKIFLSAADFSGAVSDVISLPDTSSEWYIKKPKGEVLIFDDFVGTSTSEPATKNFYNTTFSSIGGGVLADKFDVFNLAEQTLPFLSVTMAETMKLFKYVFWYSAADPSLDLLNVLTSKFLASGGKIAFSMTFQDSTSSYPYDISSIQGFIPIDSMRVANANLFANASVRPLAGLSEFPTLVNTDNVQRIRVYQPNQIISENIYELYNREGVYLGIIGFRTQTKNLFFIGAPLHLFNGGSQNVDELLEQIFFDDFGVTP